MAPVGKPAKEEHMGLTEAIAGIEPGKHKMAVLDDTGDTKIIWDPENRLTYEWLTHG
jgi:hypothetical protein